MKKSFGLKSISGMHIRTSNSGGAVSISSSGLILHLDASNSASYPGSGNIWYDLSATKSNATVTQQLSFSTTNGGCFSNTQFNLGDPEALRFGTGNFTASVWVNPDVTVYGPNSQGTIISKNYTGTEMMFYQGLATGYVGATGMTQQSPEMSCAPNNWYLLTIRREGGVSKIYKNLTYIASAEFSGDVSSVGTNWNIGQRSTGGNGALPLSGKIAAVYMYNRAISDRELSDMFNTTKTKFGYGPSFISDSLVAHLDATNPSSYSGSGTNWLDLTGNGNNAVINTSVCSYVNDGGLNVLNMSPSGTNRPGEWTLSQPIISNTVTMMAWVKPTSATQDNWTGILSERTTANGTSILFSNLGNTNLSVQWNGNYYANSTGIAAPVNEWCLLTLVVTPTSITPYVNGVPGNVISANMPAITFTKINIGFDVTFTLPDRVFKGRYGAALFYNKSLSATEVASMVNYFQTKKINAG